jgi:hypothetical protein
MKHSKYAQSKRRSIGAVFAIPSALAALSIFGLVSALTGDGLRDVLSWVGLGIPVAAAGWAWSRRR